MNSNTQFDPKPVTIISNPIIVGMFHEIYISGEILGPEYYIEEYNIIRNAQDCDVIKFILNTHGGRVDSALQFIRVMSESNAHLIASIEGHCMSAGTMIFLAADEFEIAPNSSIMIHNYSGGTQGKGHEMHTQIMFEHAWSKEFLRSTYEEFLTPQEIEALLLGSDLWLTSTQVAERCTKLLKFRQEMMELIQEDEQANL